MAYNTNNPLGSNDFRDLSDNAEYFDKYVGGPQPAYPNRFGAQKLSIEGQQQAFLSAQSGRQAQFEAVLASIGFSAIGDYGAGVTFTTRQQYTVRAGLAYAVANDTTLPFTLTGTWATDEPKLKLINSDQILRSDLAQTSGADIVGWKRADLSGDTTVSKMLKASSVNIFEFLSDAQIADVTSGAGATDFTAEIAMARSVAAELNLPLYLPGGTYRISSPIIAPPSGIHGDGAGSTIILCNGCSAIVFPFDLGLARSACIITKIRFSSVGSTCDTLFAISAPGVATGANPQYNSGITVVDVSFFRFGGCFYIKDCFEFNVDRVIASQCTRIVQLVGSVAQSYFSRISAFSDNAPRLLPLRGFSTEAASYSNGGILTPEHITTRDLSLIRFDHGIYHTAGLAVTYYDTDLETYICGAYVTAPCIISGGIIAMSPGGPSGWIGIQRLNADFEVANGITIENVEINTFNSVPANISESFGIDIGNGAMRSVGTTIKNVVFRGGTASLNHAIRARLLGASLSITDCKISGIICPGNPVNISSAHGLVFSGNSCSTGDSPIGILSISDDASADSYGTVYGNRFASMELAITKKSNWSVYNNEGDKGVLPTAFLGIQALTSSVPASSNLQTTLSVLGASVGDAVVVGYSGMVAGLAISGFVESSGVVKVTLQNLTASAISIDGTIRALSYRL